MVRTDDFWTLSAFLGFAMKIKIVDSELAAVIAFDFSGSK